MTDSAWAIPSGAIISLAPRFGWLLYQGEEEEEELDLVFESEFLYRFPHEEEEEEEESHSEPASHERRGWGRSPWRPTGDIINAIDQPTGFLLHRNKRMVRDKKMVYSGLENVFSILGLDGRACLLRAICEVSATPLVYDGIVGELLNIALVPRHTNGHHEDLTRYLEAEEHGKLDSDCGAVYPACPVSLFQKVAPGSMHFE
ncbi:uncharacterized protein LOC119095085 [Pollicipes pollicipes]|uniref:uncharacterized protein LOC119095085 n=1 Tax=Pollicipes pollicipes TaxID=41117 RepID=UPI0018851743|nr:uncharacterized protein LOC119095085 [Pollicipes pollicipes]